MHKWIAAALICLVLTGCYSLRRSSGGGETVFAPPRSIEVSDIVVPDEYRVEVIAQGLTFPTGVAFDDEGGIYVVEAGYSYGERFTTPRLLRIGPDGRQEVVAASDRSGPWTGSDFRNGHFYVAEGSQIEGGSILRIALDGEIVRIVSGLPSRGDHHVNGPACGPDDWIYFGQGTMTNAAIVGKDNADFGWLGRFPQGHDIPCRDVVLAGENYDAPDPFSDRVSRAKTGAFVPFGTATAPGQIIPGEVPCSGSILRVRPEGGEPELVAWGVRNPFGLAFSSDGRLFVTDNSYDVRGSRPVFGAGDLLWEIVAGTWYGWPDYHGNRPLYAGDRYRHPRLGTPKRLLESHPQTPPAPVAYFAVHSSSNGLDFSRSEHFGHVGEAFVAQFGDMAPGTGKVMAPAGFKVVRVDINSGVVRDFALNRQGYGPASLLRSGGLERPVAARFDPSGEALFIVDFGVMLHQAGRPVPIEGTGVLWRIIPKR